MRDELRQNQLLEIYFEKLIFKNTINNCKNMDLAFPIK